MFLLATLAPQSRLSRKAMVAWTWLSIRSVEAEPDSRSASIKSPSGFGQSSSDSWLIQRLTVAIGHSSRVLSSIAASSFFQGGDDCCCCCGCHGCSGLNPCTTIRQFAALVKRLRLKRCYHPHPLRQTASAASTSPLEGEAIQRVTPNDSWGAVLALKRTPPPRGGRTGRHRLSSPLEMPKRVVRRAKSDGGPRWGCRGLSTMSLRLHKRGHHPHPLRQTASAASTFPSRGRRFKCHLKHSVRRPSRSTMPTGNYSRRASQ
jgi:hypothetical protein